MTATDPRSQNGHAGDQGQRSLQVWVMRASLVIALLLQACRVEDQPSGESATGLVPCPGGVLEPLDDERCGASGLQCLCDGTGRVAEARRPSPAIGATAPSQDVSLYEYSDGHLSKVRTSALGSWSETVLEYRGDGRRAGLRTSTRDGTGAAVEIVVSYEYDDAGRRVLERSSSTSNFILGGLVRYDYDATGRLVRRQIATEGLAPREETYRYDGQGKRLGSETLEAGRVVESCICEPPCPPPHRGCLETCTNR